MTNCGTPPKKNLLRGKIHGYYRIYWGKIIEWLRTPEEAQRHGPQDRRAG
jgi:hypothetical protein